METRQYLVGDLITMQLMRREKGALVALPSSQWVKLEEPIKLGGKTHMRTRTRSLPTGVQELDPQALWPSSRSCGAPHWLCCVLSALNFKGQCVQLLGCEAHIVQLGA